MAHPIENVMRTTMENLKDMIDVNTVIGEAVVSPDGVTVIPISRVSFGFVAGGGEYGLAEPPKPSVQGEALPFAGGTGAGVSVVPMGFLVFGNGYVRMLPAHFNTSVDRIVEMVPQLIGDVRDILKDKDAAKQDEDTAAPAYPPLGI